MSVITDALGEWLRKILTDGITANLSGLFDSVNEKVAGISSEVSASPVEWNSSVFTMIRTLSDNVILPVAGVILALVMTVEFITLITERNNMRGDFDTFIFFRWILKTAAAVLIVTNTWEILAAVFDLAGNAVERAAAIIPGAAGLDNPVGGAELTASLEAMDMGELFGLWLQSGVVSITVRALAVCIFIISYGRMIEIYLVSSLAPVPMAAMLSKNAEGIGTNYLKSLFALAFQGFLIIICVAIYAVLIGNIPVSRDISGAMWTSVGYTVLLCFALFRTGSVSKSIFAAR